MGLLDDAIREHLELKRLRGGDPAEVARQEREALGPVRRGGEPQEPDVHTEDQTSVAAAYPPPEPAEPAFTHEEPIVERAAAGDEVVAPEPHRQRPILDETAEGAHAEPAAYGPAEPHELDDAAHEPYLPADEHVPPVPSADASPPAAPEPALPETELHPHVPEAGDEPLRIDPQSPLTQETAEFDVEAEVSEELEQAPYDVEHPVEPPPAPAEYAPAPAEEHEQHGPPEHPAGEEDEEEDVLEETPDFLQETPEHDRLWFEQQPPRDFDFNE